MSSSSRSEAAPAVALLVGSETTLRDAALADLRERALGSGPRDFNEDRYDFATSGTDKRAVLTACRMLPVMSQSRIVIVSGLADKRAKPFVEEVLPDYLDDPSPTTCLVLSSERVDRRLKWVKKVGSVGEVIDCNGPKRAADVRDWIDARFRTRGVKPGAGAAATLFDLVGADLDRLAFEVEKACLFAGDAAEVSVDDVTEVTASLRPLAVYELTDAIGGRRLAEALRVLARLRDQGDAPLQVLAALANHFRRMLRAHDCKPMNAGSVQKALSLHPFTAKKLVEQARRFEPRRLESCLRAVRRTDEALKGAVPLADELAIEQLVVSVCS
jgi:DNA polymerase-3 subunit delta